MAFRRGQDLPRGRRHLDRDASRAIVDDAGRARLGRGVARRKLDGWLARDSGRREVGSFNAMA